MEGIKRRHLGAQAWRELLARQASSGESVSVFCRREGLSPNSLRRWRERLATQALGDVSREAAPSARVARGFVDLGVLGGATAPAAGRLELHLELGGGITLHVVRG